MTHSTTPAAAPSARSWQLTHLFCAEGPGERALEAARRVGRLARELPAHASLAIQCVGNGNGAVAVTLELSHEGPLTTGDVEWALEPVGSAAATEPATAPAPFVHAWEITADSTLALPVPSSQDNWDAATAPARPGHVRFALSGVITSLRDLMLAVSAEPEPVAYVVHLSPASPVELQMAAEEVAGLLGSLPEHTLRTYLGEPTRVRAFLLAASGRPGSRVFAALRALGEGVGIRPLPGQEDATHLLRAQPNRLLGYVRPGMAVETLVRIPASGEAAERIGIPAGFAPSGPVRIVGVPDGGGSLRLGVALDAAGTAVAVTQGAADLLQHMQVVGASGTGKSTLLAAMVGGAVRAGYGCSVLSPHPDLVARLLRELPASADVAVVHSGDEANPVPLNPLAAHPDTGLENLMVILQDLIDPHNTGMFGMRARRAISQGLRAATALVGPAANITMLEMILRDQRTVTDVALAIEERDPDTALQMRSELARLSPQDFAEVSAWLNSRLHLMAGSPAVRRILGTGEDAVDVVDVMDRSRTLLVDLDSTVIGIESAKVLGEFYLLKHFEALSRRRNRNAPHLLVVDECHLFTSGMLPRLLAEGRKFGLGVVIAHQHLGQLAGNLREAAQGNTSSLVAFRTGPTEAAHVHVRLGGWPGDLLSRLPNLQAAATITTGGTLTAPFTLRLDHNETAVPDEHAAALHEEASRGELVEPYRALPTHTASSLWSVVARLNAARIAQQSPSERAAAPKSILDEFLEYRRADRSSRDSGTPGSARTGSFPTYGSQA